MTGKELTQWRRERGISQGELAQLLGTYQVTVCRWEKEARGIPFLLPLALEGLEHRLKEVGKNGLISGMSRMQEAQPPEE